jgi:cell division protein FtsA
MKTIAEKSEKTRARLVLDVGTEYVKALVVSLGQQPAVLGAGRAKQGIGDMEGGAVSNIPGVVHCCLKAIDQATKASKVYPIEAVMGIAGEFVQGSISTIKSRRPRPNRALSRRELDKMTKILRRQASDDAKNRLRAQTGLEELDVQLVNTSIVEVKIDGHKVNNPIDFKGTYLELSAFNTFSPLIHIEALKTVAQRLNLLLVGTIAEPYAVALGALPTEAADFGAVVVDVGGGSTDMAVVRNHAVVATKSVPLGGRSFTRSFAIHFDIDIQEAESYKLDYAAGLLDEQTNREIRQFLADDLQVYKRGLEFCFSDLAIDKPLPGKIFVCGGGAALPGIKELFEQGCRESGVFEKPPTVRFLNPEDASLMADPEGVLHGMGDVTPKCLGIQAVLAGIDPW